MNDRDRKRFHGEYLKVLKHRKHCPKWGKDFCLECFGGGLSRFVEQATGEKL